MSTPTVPPRPQRAQASPSPVKNETPNIPPRPVRLVDPSPDRESSTRSPLNQPPPAPGTVRQVRPRTSQDLPRRPPSVALPDVGHEGEEYSSFDRLPDEARISSASEQTRNVSADLPMHQPKASVSLLTAKRQIQTVTRTDSAQAAAAGVGNGRNPEDLHKIPQGDAAAPAASPVGRPGTDPLLRSKPSFNRSSSSLQQYPGERTTSRPASIHGDDHEHGIPEIGRQVPLLHMAGDVQAPTPVSSQPQHARGIGFFNDGSSRAHVRKRSSRQEFGPPDSYGLHHDHPDQLEKEWIRKHPQEAAKEGHYNHLPKPETALTSEQLNRLVHQSDAPIVGSASTPDNGMTDDYLERLSSAAPSPAPEFRQPTYAHSGSPAPNSPQQRLRPEDALPVDDYSNHRSETPILAEDEIVKRPSSAFMHAAVLPDPDSHPDEHYDSDTGRNSRRSSLQMSRPSSTHGGANYHGGSLHRFISHEELNHAHLEEIEEYEPLFPEDEKGASPRKVFKKRPELAQHHFPSSDVWEDSPSSLQYSTTVSTPDLERTMESLDDDKAAATTTTAFETSEAEQRRRSATGQHDMSSDSKTFIKPRFKAGVAEDLHRPGTHRFPSSDVWEDSPDSYTLVNQTTVGETPVDDASVAPDEETQTNRPTIPARPQRRSKLAAGAEVPPAAPEPAPITKAKPPIPARPGGEKIAAMKAGFMSDLNNRLKLGPQGSPPKKEAEPEANEEETRAPLADARKTRAKGPARRKPATSPATDRRSSNAFAFSPLIHCWSIDEEDELQVHDAAEKNKENLHPGAAVEKESAVDETASADKLAAHISNVERPQDIAGQYEASESELKAALAVVGAAPPSFNEEQ